MKDAISALRVLEHQNYAYRYAQSVINFDGETVAPADSADGRAEAIEVLSRAQFDLLTAPSVDQLLDQADAAADAAPDGEQVHAEVRELRRTLSQIRPIPAEEYAAFERLTQEATAAWAKAKKASDFSVFAPYLEKLVAGRRRQAQQIAPDKDPYETLLDQYEKGLTIEKCDQFFATVRGAIVPLLEAIQTRGSAIRTDFLDQEWPVSGQRVLSQKVMELWGLDPQRCVLAESEHPFTDGFNTRDVRITTHYMPRDLLSNLYSVAHEGGHALYELHVDHKLDYTVLAGGASMSLHESQSRLFENMVGRSRGCIHLLWPAMQEQFGGQLAGVTEEELYRAANRAEPGLIRTEADELTYCLHIMVRYEIEKQLVGGTLDVKDVPATWNRLYKEYLGVDVPDDKRGCLQDSHWSGGSFGYFPSYALGSAYGAQMLRNMEREFDVWGPVSRGDLSQVSAWLRDKVHQYGGLLTPAEVVRNACGDFDPAVYTDYLIGKYSKLYEL